MTKMFLWKDDDYNEDDGYRYADSCLQFNRNLYTQGGYSLFDNIAIRLFGKSVSYNDLALRENRLKASVMINELTGINGIVIAVFNVYNENPEDLGFVFVLKELPL